MRTRARMCAFLLAAMVSAVLISQRQLNSQGICPGTGAIKQARNDEELDLFFERWERALSKRRGMTARLRLCTYEPIFEVERRGSGTIRWRRPGRSALELTLHRTPAAVPKGDQQQTLDQTAAVTLYGPEKWFWIDGEIIRINKKDRTYWRGRPPSSGSWSFLGVPLCGLQPFIVGSLRQELEREYEITIHPVRKDGCYSIVFIGKEDADFDRVELVVRKKGMVPTQITVFQPNVSHDGDSRCPTVIQFQDLRFFEAEKECPEIAVPDLKAYREEGTIGRDKGN